MAPARTGASATIRTTTAANGTQTRLRADGPAIGETIIAFPLSPRSLPRDQISGAPYLSARTSPSSELSIADQCRGMARIGHHGGLRTWCAERNGLSGTSGLIAPGPRPRSTAHGCQHCQRGIRLIGPAREVVGRGAGC